MAKNGVFRETSIHRPLEGIYIVDSFSNKGAFMENVLIGVGDFPCVRIDACVAAKEPDEPGSPGARQTHAHARLHNAVPRGDNPALWIELRTVQGMGHRSDKLPGRIARKLGIGVESDDILD